MFTTWLSKYDPTHEFAVQQPPRAPCTWALKEVVMVPSASVEKVSPLLRHVLCDSARLGQVVQEPERELAGKETCWYESGMMLLLDAGFTVPRGTGAGLGRVRLWVCGGEPSALRRKLLPCVRCYNATGCR